MMYQPISNPKIFKEQFQEKLNGVYIANPIFFDFIHETKEKGNIFIIGGFIRSIQTDVIPRDIDIIIDIPTSDLGELVSKYFQEYTNNRLGGFKIKLDYLTFDIWNLNSNWAIQESLTSRKGSLRNIANGTFYNFDSLVAQLFPLIINVRKYNECITTNVLDIVIKDWNYSRRNPTREANFLRALYLQKNNGFIFSKSVKKYLYTNLKTLEFSYRSAKDRLIWYLNTDDKYREHVTEYEIEKFIEFVLKESQLQQFVNESNLQLKIFDINKG